MICYCANVGGPDDTNSARIREGTRLEFAIAVRLS